MNKNAIYKYAIWARNELIEQVKQRAYQYGISEKGYGDENATVISGRVLSPDEKRQRRSFVDEIKKSGYKQAVEEVAYTWFNRFVALRYMEVNDFLPTHVRVFSDTSGNFKPEILTNVLHLDLPGLDKAKVSELLNANATEELYRYLLLTQCNALNSLLPEMFERMGAYTEMLLPNNILKPESVVGRLVKDIPEEDFRDAVQIIGWLYQYYNTEPKQAVFDGLKKNIKITKENIPAATQLFTPDWIVRYMVENSLGRLWLESHPNSPLREGWKYYLDEAEQTPEIANRLRVLRTENAVKSPEDIKVIDPCMGSGHILVYAFDVLIQIYTSEGYSERDASKLILEKNIYGLELDRRAYQLAYFALMMKARQYNRRILTLGVRPQVYEPTGYTDGMEYGSLVRVDKLEPMPEPPKEQQLTLFDSSYDTKLNTWNFRRLLAQKYDVVVTNPPYMGSKGMSGKLVEFLTANYPDEKGDASTAFMSKTIDMCNSNGIMAMINIPVWMSKSTYETLRRKFLVNTTFCNMLHFGRGIFGSDFGTVAFTVYKRRIPVFRGTYLQLFDELGSVDNITIKQKWFFERKNQHSVSQDHFLSISSYPIAYWVSEKLLKILAECKPLSYYADARKGLTTGDNDTFVRLWHEIQSNKFTIFNTTGKWVPMTKGGDFRRWYGNNEYVINWENDGVELRNFNGSVIRNPQYYFRECISWNDTTATGKIAFRYQTSAYIPNASGPCVYCSTGNLLYYFGLLNSCASQALLFVLAPNMKFEVGQMSLVPIILTEGYKTDQIVSAVNDCVQVTHVDWDEFETSWDFKRHPLICNEKSVATAFAKWEREAADRFKTLKSNEEELNRIFIDIYGLQDELTPGVENKDITLKTNTAYRYKQKKKKSNDKFEMQKETVESEEIREAKFLLDTICEFISYAVGCMFGRYSLDCEGLAFAGGEWDAGKYKTFPADKDNILPICDDEYFDGDIAGRFVDFVKTVYRADTLEENLKFIADALGGKGTPREVIRNYFLNDFYKDHCKIYQNRPIYWLFDSGKKNGFKALIYMHRYSRDLLAKLRTDYVHEQQERYRTQLSHIAGALNTATGAERARLLKQQDKLSEQAREIGAYEENLHHLADMNITIDLDDGVKKNYEIFADVLAKI